MSGFGLMHICLSVGAETQPLSQSLCLRRVMKSILYFLLCLTLVACNVPTPAQPTPTPDYSTLVVTMERTPCFGTCPVYQLTIRGDGSVAYQGEMFVAVEGAQTAAISAEQIQALVTAIEAADFFSLADDYSAPATDLPSTIISVTFNGQSKQVNHYGVCGLADIDAAPKGLCDLEKTIDDVTDAAQWVGQRP